MKQTLYILLFFTLSSAFAQKDNPRIDNIKNQLTALSIDNAGLTENVKTEVNVNNISLSNFLIALSNLHKVNINVSPELNQINIVNNFSNVVVADVLVWLCKEYNLTIDFTGNILSIKPYQKPSDKPEERIIPIAYYPNTNTISIDVQGDKLSDVFRRITDETARNLFYSPGLDNKLITVYIQNVPFDDAMNQLAFTNNLFVDKTKEGFYQFEDDSPAITSNANNATTTNNNRQRPTRRRSSNFFFKVIDIEKQLLEVDFVNTPIADIINDIGSDLKIDVFTATPLDNAGVATFKAKSIAFDDLLTKLFEAQQSASVTNSTSNNNTNPSNQNISVTGGNTNFNFKKENGIYFFGTENQLSIRTIAIIPLQFRSIELLSNPSGGLSNRRVGRTYNTGNNFTNLNNPTTNQFNNTNNRNSNFQNNTSNFRGNNSQNNPSDNLLSLISEEVQDGLDIKIDYELNSFYVTGPNAKIERFRNYVSHIDKPVPVVLIEVMIIEVSRRNVVETGITWGIGDTPTDTRGNIFPTTDLTLSSQTVNRIIGSFNDFAGTNLGKVGPNFFATIKAMEANGDLKIRSTPKLATLNGHRATFSSGETSYYAITEQAIIGSDNPITQTAVTYAPIDAELGLTIKPSVSGNGKIQLDINVIQSNFGDRIADDAPPDINSREFSSIISMQDQDIAILGGLEEQLRNNSGTGVPFLARIPIIKWFFSSRKREASKSKLTVLIKPTIIY